MITSGFFNSVNGDRKYDASRFSEYFATFIGDGVFPNPSTNLQVMAQLTPDMTVIVKTGKAWINGYIMINDDDYILNIEPADGVLSRIDRIVARYDTVDREIRLEVKQGAYSSSPIAPILQRDADAYELGLADVLVSNGVISITQSNITDLRFNSELCGIVHGTVEQVDTTAIFNQFESWYAQTKANYDADIATWTQEKKDAFDLWYTTNINEFTNRFNTWFSENATAWDSEFTEWFDSIRGQLEGDVAANLASQVTDLQNTKVDKTALALTDANLDTLNNNFSSHSADITNEQGRHGIRFKNGLEVKIDGEWKVAAPPPPPVIYGVEIDEDNSNPETAVIYTDDAVGFTPASGNNGAFNWGSWESIIKDEFMIRPCVLNNPAKTVNYYLDYDNYNLKATGGASNLTGADGDVMTEFGADIYTKWTVVGSKHKIQFSIKPFEGATKNAFETENGYNQFTYYPLLLTQKLFQMIFKNRDSQTALGRGYVDGNTGYATTGNTNIKGFMFGETTGKQQMKFLGIEDYWGNKYQWIDGLVTDASYNILIGNSGFNDSGSGYTSYASGVLANTAGYIDTVQGGNDKGFIIKSKAGSQTTHYCDYGYLYSGRVARFGGDRSDGSHTGFARLRLDADASSAAAFVGARLMCVNNNKLYIGAYLGTTQGGKLRSVSGTTPSDNKTISVFRNEAKTNNV